MYKMNSSIYLVFVYYPIDYFQQFTSYCQAVYFSRKNALVTNPGSVSGIMVDLIIHKYVLFSFQDFLRKK